MAASTKNSLETGFDQTNKSYKELVEQLTLIGQAKENIESLSNEVISLKNVLENNQNRGRFGELALERILFSIFGDAKEGVYAYQYNLKNLLLLKITVSSLLNTLLIIYGK